MALGDIAGSTPRCCVLCLCGSLDALLKRGDCRSGGGCVIVLVLHNNGKIGGGGSSSPKSPAMPPTSNGPNNNNDDDRIATHFAIFVVSVIRLRLEL